MVGKKHRAKKPSDNKPIQSTDEQSFEILINNMVDGVVRIDPKGIVQMYNAATLQLLDTNQTLTGQPLHKILKLVDQDDQPVNLPELIKPINHSITLDNFSMKFTDGDKIRLELTISPVKDSQTAGPKPILLGYIILIRDITKLKNLEEERDEFISVVSHELRTPITVAEGTLANLDLLIERKADIEAIKKFAHMAHDQILLLASMVNDLASLARAERLTEDEVEEIDLEKLTKSIYQKYQPLAAEQGLRFDLDVRISSKKVVTNKLYLEEIIQNLIGNAIKYTPKGGVTLRLNQIKPDQIEFAIQDTGVGIPKTDREKIFQKFFRVEDYRTRETSGTGLGLYVSQKLAQKIGTKINLISRLNYGSTFSFILKV